MPNTAFIQNTLVGNPLMEEYLRTQLPNQPEFIEFQNKKAKNDLIASMNNKIKEALHEYQKAVATFASHHVLTKSAPEANIPNQIINPDILFDQLFSDLKADLKERMSYIQFPERLKVEEAIQEKETSIQNSYAYKILIRTTLLINQLNEIDGKKLPSEPAKQERREALKTYAQEMSSLQGTRGRNFLYSIGKVLATVGIFFGIVGLFTVGCGALSLIYGPGGVVMGGIMGGVFGTIAGLGAAGGFATAEVPEPRGSFLRYLVGKPDPFTQKALLIGKTMEEDINSQEEAHKKFSK